MTRRLILQESFGTNLPLVPHPMEFWSNKGMLLHQLKSGRNFFLQIIFTLFRKEKGNSWKIFELSKIFSSPQHNLSQK